MDITTTGWYLLSISSEQTWDNAKTYWGLTNSTVYQYIYELSGVPIQTGTLLTNNNWTPIDVSNNNPVLKPYKGYWVNVTSIQPTEPEPEPEPEPESNTLGFTINGPLSIIPTIVFTNNQLNPDTSYNVFISLRTANQVSPIMTANTQYNDIQYNDITAKLSELVPITTITNPGDATSINEYVVSAFLNSFILGNYNYISNYIASSSNIVLRFTDTNNNSTIFTITYQDFYNLINYIVDNQANLTPSNINGVYYYTISQTVNAIVSS
jgi:hypothetical protein